MAGFHWGSTSERILTTFFVETATLAPSTPALESAPPSFGSPSGFPEFKQAPAEVQEFICNAAAVGLTLSEIGAMTSSAGVTPREIMRILQDNGLGPELPPKLEYLISKAVAARKHLEENQDKEKAKFHLIRIESRIHWLAKYYKDNKRLPSDWKFNSAAARALVP